MVKYKYNFLDSIYMTTRGDWYAIIHTAGGGGHGRGVQGRGPDVCDEWRISRSCSRGGLCIFKHEMPEGQPR